MSRAIMLILLLLTGATAALAVGPGDEVKREAVAHFILDYIRTHQCADATRIRDAAVRSLGWLAAR